MYRNEIDHRNTVKLDNGIRNLREATHAQNMANKNKPKNNTSGHKGVYWAKRQKKWQCSIFINGKNKHLGYFSDLHECIEVRKMAYQKLFGEYARTE